MEVWKEIYGFPHYEVSNLGRVRSKDRYILRHGTKSLFKGKVLEGGTDSDGYRIVLLYYSAGGGRNTEKVHRLVMKTFCPITLNLQVNHIDGNKQNNNLDNLEWSTAQENIEHAQKLGLRVSRKVAKLDLKTLERLEVFETTYAVKKAGFSSGHVSECCRGKRKSHKGFKWEFID